MIRIALFALALSPAAAFAAAPIDGHWITHDGKAVVEIGPCGARSCGRIAKLLVARTGGPMTDIHNPDPMLRGRAMEGLVVLTGFAPAGRSWHGEIYSPEDGKSYRSTIERSGPDRLKLRGCVARIFCKSFIWKRAP